MHTQKELQRKKIAELRRIAADLGIDYHKSWIRKKLIKEIIIAQGKESEPARPEPDQPGPINPDFEKAAAEKAAEPIKDNRGGARPGAGRPPGLTAEKARVKNLPQYPSQPIRQGVCCLFDLWSSAAKIEELALSDDEADLLSLPLTQLQEYYFPGILPEIAGTWIMLIYATTRVVKPRINIVNKVRAERRAAKTGGKEPEKTEPDNPDMTWHFAEPGGKPLHPIGPDKNQAVTFKASKVTCQTCIKLMAKKSLN